MRDCCGLKRLDRIGVPEVQTNVCEDNLSMLDQILD